VAPVALDSGLVNSIRRSSNRIRGLKSKRRITKSPRKRKNVVVEENEKDNKSKKCGEH
jgi:hypothetical protein